MTKKCRTKIEKLSHSSRAMALGAGRSWDEMASDQTAASQTATRTDGQRHRADDVPAARLHQLFRQALLQQLGAFRAITRL